MSWELDPNTNQWMWIGPEEPEVDTSASGTYRLPEDANVTTRDAQGNPTAYEWHGETYYPPGSIEFAKGFRTESERVEDGGGRQVGVHQGESVPEDTVLLLDDKGKAIRRYTQNELASVPGALAAHEQLGQLRYPVKDFTGKEHLLTREQYAKLAAAQTPMERLDAYKSLNLIPEGWTLDDFTGETGRKEATKEAAESFVIQQEAKRQRFLAAKELKAFEAKLKEQPQELQDAYRTGGVDGYDRAVDEYNKNFEQNNVKLPDGVYIPDSALKGLPEKYSTIALTQGYKALNEAMDADEKLYNRALSELQPYKGKEPDTYDIVKYLQSKKGGQESWKIEQLKNAGFQDADIKSAKEEADLTFLQKTGRGLKVQLEASGPKSTTFSYKGKEITSAEKDEILKADSQKRKEYLQSLKDSGIPSGAASRMVVDKFGDVPQIHQSGASFRRQANAATRLVVPFVATVQDWKELAPGEKALYLTLDALGVAFYAGGAVRGARAVASAGRLAMAKGAIAGIGTEALAQLEAPLSVIIHPIGTVKSTISGVENVVENIADPRKIPYMVLTTSYHTTKIPITPEMPAAEGKAARDLAMETFATKGGKVSIQTSKYLVEIPESAFMKQVRKAGGALVTGTPDITPFKQVLIVKTKEGKALNQQGLFFAQEPLPRFSEATSGGGPGVVDAPGFYIVSRETAAQTVTSGKTYGGTIELERVLPVGAKTTGAKQRLYTRLGPNAVKTEILLEKPLSALQIAGLKIRSITEGAVKLITPDIEIIPLKGSGLSRAQVKQLSNALRKSGNTSQANNLVSASRLIDSGDIARLKLRGAPKEDSARARLLQSASRTANYTATSLPAPRMELSNIARRLKQKAATDRINRVSTAERLDRIETGTRAERATKAERLDRIETGTRAERATKAERADRLQAAERIDRTDKTERIERVEKTDKISRLEKITRIDRIPRIDRPDRPPRIPVISIGKSGKAARKLIARADGAIGWRQGELHGIDRWDVITNIYKPGQEQYVIVMGDKPKGASIVKGPGSAFRTAQILYGKKPLPGRATINQPGLFTTRLDPLTGKRIQLTFVHDAGISQKRSVFPLAGSNNAKRMS